MYGLVDKEADFKRGITQNRPSKLKNPNHSASPALSLSHWRQRVADFEKTKKTWCELVLQVELCVIQSHIATDECRFFR